MAKHYYGASKNKRDHGPKTIMNGPPLFSNPKDPLNLLTPESSKALRERERENEVELRRREEARKEAAEEHRKKEALRKRVAEQRQKVGMERLEMDDLRKAFRTSQMKKAEQTRGSYQS